jgi:PKHD-type hydroxylase
MFIPWHQRGPIVVDDLLNPDLCRQLLGEFDSGDPQPRSYQGVVDTTLRNCEFVPVSAHSTQVVSTLLQGRLDEAFGASTEVMTDQPVVIYRYGPGVGFTTHHDEVTEIELERAETNGQPVIGGDLTAVLFLNSPEGYEGGELYFEDPPSDGPTVDRVTVDDSVVERVQVGGRAKEFRPPAGTLVAFPATKQFPHGVRKVLSGNRFVLLARLAVRDESPVRDGGQVRGGGAA